MVIMQNYSSEISRKTINFSKNEETACEWCNSHLAVRTGKGIHFYEFSHNLECYDKKLDFVESFVSTPTSSVATSIFECRLVRTGLKNREMAEMMLDPAMWAHSEYLVREMTNVLAFQFSPPGLMCNKAYPLAILNNIGNVELFSVKRCEWTSILNISSMVKEQFKEMVSVNPKKFSELKKIAYNLASCAICWAPNVNKNFCYFVTSQRSGILLFWLIHCQENDVTAKFCGKIELVFGEINHLKWIPKSENSFILFCSNILGQVMLLECQINKENVIMMKSHMIWEYQDRMIVKYSEYCVDENKILLFYNKHRHLVAQLLDESCRVISQSVDNINDYRVTSLRKNFNQCFVTTVNFKLYKINFSTENNFLKINFELIEVKDISPTMEVYSIRFSGNGVICALSAIDRKILHKKDPLLMETIFIQAAPDNVILDTLLKNPTKLLTNYRDCIELLRYKITKQKMLPQIDYKALLSEGENDIYKLKIYLVILRIYRSLVSNIKIVSGCLPEDSIVLVKDKILAVKANTNIKKWNHKHLTGKLLSDFEKEGFAGSRNYLHHYNKKYKTTLSDMATPDMLDLVKDEFNYTCQCCDEQVNKDFTCKNGHLNMFCSLTFTSIETFDYLSCKYCNSVAAIKILSKKPLCVFCDSYLESYNFCDQ